MVSCPTTGMSHLSNSMPISRSIQGKEFSWPTATSTSSHSKCWSGSPVGTRCARPFSSFTAVHLLEGHAGELAVLVREFLGHEEVEDRDVLVDRVFLLPGRGLHFLEARADDHLHVFAAEAARRAAAVHRGVAAAEHDDALADLVDVAERDAGQPVDADMDVGGGFLAAGNVEIAAARRAGADEDRVVAFGQQRLQAVDALAEVHHGAEAGDVADFLVDHFFGQAEARDLAADHAAGLLVAVEDVDLVAERREIARDGQRGRAGADAGDLLAVLRRRAWAGGGDIVLVVGRDAFQAADRDRLLFHAAAPAGGLARTIAGAPEDSREHVGLPIDHVGVGVAPGGDQADVFGHRRVGGTRPLAIDNLVEIVRTADVRSLQRIPLGSFGCFLQRCWEPTTCRRRRSTACSRCSKCRCTAANGLKDRTWLVTCMTAGCNGYPPAVWPS